MQDARRLRFTTNHDETMWDAPPPALFDGLEGSKAAFVLATSMPGAPLVYNGQELGVTDSVSFFARTPYDWTRQPEIRGFFRDYLNLYNESSALQAGTLTVHTPEAEDALVYERTADDETMLVAANVRDASQTVSVPEAYADASLTNALTGETMEGDTLSLGPYGYRLLRVE